MPLDLDPADVPGADALPEPTDRARVFAWLNVAPVEDLEEIKRRFCSGRALQQRRNAERDHCFRLLAGFYPIGKPTSIAKPMYADLSRYCSGEFRHEREKPPPTDPKRRLMHRALVLNNGDVPSVRSLPAILGPKSGANFDEILRMRPCDVPIGAD